METKGNIMNNILHVKRLRLLSVALALLALSPLAQAAPGPKPEDRGNGNSAAENVQALNPSATGSQNTAHGWFSLLSTPSAT